MNKRKTYFVILPVKLGIIVIFIDIPLRSTCFWQIGYYGLPLKSFQSLTLSISEVTDIEQTCCSIDRENHKTIPKELLTTEKHYTLPQNNRVNTTSKTHNINVYKFKEIPVGFLFLCPHDEAGWVLFGP